MKFTKKTKNIFKSVLCVVLVLATALGAAALFSNRKSDLKEIHPAFSIGGLSSSGGYVEQKNTIYTKEAFDCEGLRIDIDFENSITYRVFFYDDSGEFISSTGYLAENFVDNVPEGAELARVMISPDWAALEVEKDDRVISLFDIAKYSNQITIKVGSESKKTDEDTTLFEDDITDLGGTTWVFDSFKCSPKYLTFSLGDEASLATVGVYYSSQEKYATFEITDILLGYGCDYEEKADKVLVLIDNNSECELKVGDTITFLSSSISTDLSLIKFMRENATLINVHGAK